METCFRRPPARGRGAVGFTLVELLVVLLILCLVATLAIRRLSGVTERARLATARADLATLRDAFATYLDDMTPVPGYTPVNPYVGWDAAEVLNLRVHNLLCATNVQPASDPVVRKWAAAGALPAPASRTYDDAGACGWNGPYLATGRAAPWPAPNARRWPSDATFADRHFAFAGILVHTNDAGHLVEEPVAAAFGTTNELCLLDPWQNPYVVQFPAPSHANFPDAPAADGAAHRSFAMTRRLPYARIVSAGPDGILQTPFDLTAGATSDGTAARGDDLVLFLSAPPPSSAP